MMDRLLAGRAAARWRAVVLLALIFLVRCPGRVWACAACYGQSDSPMAEGMNWGILSLLGMIVLVLGGVVGFFVFLARKSAGLAATQLADADSRPI